MPYKFRTMNSLQPSEVSWQNRQRRRNPQRASKEGKLLERGARNGTGLSGELESVLGREGLWEGHFPSPRILLGVGVGVGVRAAN